MAFTLDSGVGQVNAPGRISDPEFLQLGSRSNAECEPFNGGNPEHQHCECHRIGFEPNTHEASYFAVACHLERTNAASRPVQQHSSLRLPARYHGPASAIANATMAAFQSLARTPASFAAIRSISAN